MSSRDAFIMGFCGGALIASPLSMWLMGKFASITDVGVVNCWTSPAASRELSMPIGPVDDLDPMHRRLVLKHGHEPISSSDI
ncbi:MAG: hypothetical protein WBA48_11510 [Xanthobacteraceae bacterium]